MWEPWGELESRGCGWGVVRFSWWCEEQGVGIGGGPMGSTYDEAGGSGEGYGRHLERGRACDVIAMLVCYAVKKKSGDGWPLSCLYMNQARYRRTDYF